MSSKLASIIT